VPGGTSQATKRERRDVITGKTLIDRGWPEGRLIGLALAAARELGVAGLDDGAVLRKLDAAREDPRTAAEDPALAPLARELQRASDLSEEALRDEPLPYGVWGPGLIEEGASGQMEDAMRLPVTVGGALMPDAHLGYGLPVGGVLATEGAVIPWAVGVDIACRMRLSVFDVDPGVLDERRDDLADVLLRNTNFGAGSKYKEGRRPYHEVLDDSAWEATSFLRGLKDAAAAQLGTSGSGNHFVEWGVFEPLGEVSGGAEEEGVREEGAETVFEPGRRYLALLSHSGSRGVGFKIAERYSRIAKEKHPGLDRRVADLSWLDLGSEEGEEYWVSMTLAGRFASANHAVIHDKVAKALAEDVLAKVENHHNYAWREEVGGREAIVHRKGATPAGPGVLGVIPGSMGDPGYVVRGRGNAASLNSASHGAGRLMSRRAALSSIPEAEWRRYLGERGVTLIGGSLDEAPQAYKDIETVVALQNGDLVDLVGRFSPRIVRMDAAGNPRRKGKRSK
jgi:tRNA-splicing ligase RtcB